jgi:RsiW-degrading membrane proteinase PrsW (M82 family)
MNLLILAIAPIVVLLLFMYYRDRYEKEPVKLLITAFGMGILSILPVLLIESFFSEFTAFFYGTFAVFWQSFVVAATTEEFFKLSFLYWLIWKRADFNETFDGIAYAVFVSMGFAAIENVMYVFDYGPQTGLVRALTAVPAHFLFGVTMGFYFGLAKFYPQFKQRLIGAALLYPVLLHGVYDFILMSGNPFMLLLFIPFVFFMWHYGIKKIKRLSEKSIYQSNFKIQEEMLKKTE